MLEKAGTWVRKNGLGQPLDFVHPLRTLTRQSLEKYQVLAYLAAIGCGLIAGMLSPDRASALEVVRWPILALLLYTTFTQVPMAHLRNASADLRLVTATVLGNFLVIPVVVWCLMSLVADEPAIRLGVLLVLLVPCTDWFITFTHLGGGHLSACSTRSDAS